MKRSRSVFGPVVLILAILVAGIPPVIAASVTQSNQSGQNLFTYSEQFDNAAWTASGLELTVSPNADTAPDGTSSADRLTATGVNNYHYLLRVMSNVTVGRVYTYSIYVKAGTSHFINIGDSGANYVAWFNVAAGTSGNITGSTMNRITYVGGGWFRCSMTYSLISNQIAVFVPKPDNTTLVWTGDGTYISVWGAQLVQGTSPGAYNRVTGGAFGPAYVPKGATVSSQKGQNLLTYSEQFNNGAWTQEGVTISANAVSAPDGTLTADRLVETNTTGNHRVYQFPFTNASVVTASVYAKAGERTWLFLHTSEGFFAYFDLANGVKGTVVGTASIVPVGNGWYRCSLTYDHTTLGNNALLGIATGNGTFSYTGDTANGIYLWGAQAVRGTNPGSYNRATAAVIGASYVPKGTTKSSQTGQNLVVWSEQLDNGSWGTKSGVTITPNAIAAPDGTMTADRISFDVADSYFLQIPSGLSASTAYTFSIWLYAPTSSKGNIAAIIRGTNSNTPLAGAVCPVTNKWTRCTRTVTLASNDTAAWVGFENRAFTGADNLTGFFYTWGAQLVVGTKPGAYNRTTSAMFKSSYRP